MAHTNNCDNCGKEFTGNVNRRFCCDACRKYYKRHGEISLTGTIKQPKGLDSADKAGQKRTSTSDTGSKLLDHAAKRILDHTLDNWLGPSSTPHRASATHQAHTPTNTPFLIQSASQALHMPATELKRNQVQLAADTRAFLGQLMYPFKMLVWGLPGHGKSTFCLRLANEIAAHHRLLYVAGEEALNSPTLLEKQRRLLTDSNAGRCLFSNRLPNTQAEWKQALYSVQGLDLSGCKVIFYDSVTKLDITPSYVDAAANDYQLPDISRSLSHVFVTHAHKDGQQYRGDGSWGHEVDVIIRVEQGVATTEKNRFGEVGTRLTLF